jgi:hypothetical protein
LAHICDLKAFFLFLGMFISKTKKIKNKAKESKKTMFVEKQLEKLKNLLNLQDKENTKLFTIRLKKWLEKNGNTSQSITKAIIVILTDLHKQEIEQANKLKKINLEKVKNPILLRFGNEIMRLHNQGLGSRKIAEYFKLKNIKISHSTIYRFIKEQENG